MIFFTVHFSSEAIFVNFLRYKKTKSLEHLASSLVLELQSLNMHERFGLQKKVQNHLTIILFPLLNGAGKTERSRFTTN
jgi:hypothetical protein